MKAETADDLVVTVSLGMRLAADATVLLPTLLPALGREGDRRGQEIDDFSRLLISLSVSSGSNPSLSARSATYV